tara:strand:+ start:132 stop:371 length:240 start_codon:yes stop_codon:yes gene_type:complete
MNKHARLKRWVADVLCDKTMTTIQIRDAISNKNYKSSYTNSKIKQIPTTQRLTQVLRVNDEFVRVNKYDYPAEWRMKDD